MSTAQFKLDMFEGPLDLLLHLISKHKLNIYDIEIAVLLDQYLEYMAGLEQEDYEDAADFLEMAARLIYIKTVSLLPKDSEGEELKKELEGSLIEYSLCKMAAARLREQYAGGEIFVREPARIPINKTFTGEYPPEALLEAYLGMNEKARNSKPLKAEMFKPLLSRRVVSVTSKIIHVLKMLMTCGECSLDSMYDGCSDKSERVAVFLAVLELTRSGRIFLNDDNTRVYMDTAAKSRRIVSDFDDAELAADNAAAGADTAEEGADPDPVEEDTPEASAETPYEEERAEHGGEPRYLIPEDAPLPYQSAEPPVRTVYKGETKQRNALPVLRIELSPQLQRLIEEGAERSVRAENDKTEQAAEITAVMAEVAPEEIGAERSAEITAATAEVAPKEIGAERSVRAENDKTEQVAEINAVTAEVAPEEIGEERSLQAENDNTEQAAEIAAVTAEVAPEEIGAGRSAEDENDNTEQVAENPSVMAEVAPEEIGGERSAEDENDKTEQSAEITAATAEVAPEEIGGERSVRAETDNGRQTAGYRPNRFGVRYYWRPCGWAEGRLRLW